MSARLRRGLALAALLLPAAVLCGQDGAPPAFVRVALPANKVAAELARAKEGVLVRVPLSEFDDLARRARTPAAAGPRLAEARYIARLGDGRALEGSAQWKILHPGPGPALLRFADVPAFNLAVRRVRFDNRDAVFAEVPDAAGKSSPALFIDKPGEQTVTFDWSARVEAHPDGLQVELRVPRCPAASVEIDAPRDRSVSSPDGLPVLGPFPADEDDRRTWRVACGDRASVPLVLRRTAGKTPPVVSARQRTTHRLSPDGLEATHTFTLELPQEDVTSLTFRADPSLRVVHVAAPDLLRWEAKPGAAGTPTEVAVQLSRPMRDGVVEVRAIAPAADAPAEARPPGKPLSSDWSSPAVTLDGAIGRGETVELFLHPRVRLLSWQPGDFRLVSSSPADEPGGPPWRKLTLAGGGVATGGPRPRRPGGRVQIGGVEFAVKQANAWRPGEGTEFVARLDYEVLQGALFGLELALPPGWEVESADLAPADLLRSWGVRSASPRSVPPKLLEAVPGARLLAVDLRRPLRAGTGTAGTLTVRLRPTSADPRVGSALSFPDLVPVGAARREGGLGVDFDELLYRAEASAATPTEPPDAAPWNTSLPDLFYPLSLSPSSGSLRLSPRSPRYRAAVRQDVFLAAAHVTAEALLTLEAISGAPRTADVLTRGDAGPWEWSAEGDGPKLRAATRLTAEEAAGVVASLAATSPLSAAALAAARPDGGRWRLEFDRPLPLRRAVRVRGLRRKPAESLAPGLSRVDIPLVAAVGPGSERGPAEIHLRPDGADVVAAEAVGLRELTRPNPAWRAYAPAGLAPRLTVNLREIPASRLAGAGFDNARLRSRLREDGSARHHFSFEASGWPQLRLPVRLPERAVLLAAAVEGEWVERPAFDDDGRTVLVPVPARAPSQGPFRVELLYETPPASSLAGTALVAADAPSLPVEPATSDRRVSLPAGWAPLSPAMVPAASADADGDRRGPASRLASLWALGPALPWPAGKPDATDGHRRAFADASGAIRNERGGGRVALDELLAELVSGYLREAHPLLIDRRAVEAAGYRPGVEVGVRAGGAESEDRLCPWDDAPLAVLPTAAGLLLTTRAERDRLARGGVGADFLAALAAAAADGREPSSRYLSATEWLAESRPGRDGRLFPPADDDAGRTTWRAVPGSPPGEWFVRESAASALGLGLAAVVALAVAAAASRPRLRRAMLLAGVTAFGLAPAALPTALAPAAWWPMLACLGIGAAVYLGWATRTMREGVRESGHSRKSVVLGSAASAVAALVLLGRLFAQPATPEPVYVLPADGDAPRAVLAAPSLVEKLRRAAAPASAPASGVVLTAAEYEGKADGPRAEFTATFAAYSFGDGPARLELPLDGAVLTGDVLIDGGRALPEALAAPRVGFAVAVKGAGSHRVELRFRVPAADGDARQLRLGTPRVADSRLVFRLPAGARLLQPPARYAGLRVAPDGAGLKVTADLGPSSSLSLRWDEGRAAAADVSFREAHVWDIRPDGPALSSLVRFAVAGGSADRVELELPPGVEVRAASARRPRGSAETPDAPVRLSDWSVSPGPPRVLRLDFAAAVLGAVEVSLDLAPRDAWGETVLLPVPRPVGRAEGDSYLGYRASGLSAARADWLRLTGIRPQDFAPFWPAASRPSGLDYAGTFRRDPRQPPELRLRLGPLPAGATASQDVRVTAAVDSAAFKASVEVVGGDLSLVEYDLGTDRAAVAAVAGADVARWSQSGARVLVWLHSTRPRAVFDVSGTLPLRGPSPKAPKADAAARLDVPDMRPRARVVKTRLALAAAPGLSLAAENLRGYRADGDGPGYAADGPASATFAVRPGPAPEAVVRTVVRADGRYLVFEATIAYRGGGPVRVRLRDWPGEAELTGPGVGAAAAAGRAERAWSAAPAPGGAAAYRLTGRASLAEAAAGAAVPDIDVAGAALKRSVVVDKTLMADAGGEVFDLPPGRRGPRVAPREPPRAAPPEVLHAEGRTYFADDARPVHEAWYLVGHAGGELELAWPRPVEILAATVDGRNVAAGPASARAAVPLPEAGGPTRVVVRYRDAAAAARADRPDLLAPAVAGREPSAVLWTLDVPAGMRPASAVPAEWLVGRKDDRPGATRRAAVEAVRGRAALAVCREVLRAGAIQAETLEAALSQLERSLARARAALDAGADGDVALPDGRTVAKSLDDLRKKRDALVAEFRLEEQAAAARAEGARTLLGPPDPPRGVPWSRLLRPDLAAPASARLAADAAAASRESLSFAGRWLAFAALAWLCSLSAMLRVAARWFWPEALVGLGAWGYHVVGPTPVVAVLVAAGAAGRVVTAIQGLGRMIRGSPRDDGSRSGRLTRDIRPPRAGA